MLTRNTQPAILATSIAAHAVWTAHGGPAAAFVAGHSLGEYSALVAAGALSARRRGARGARARRLHAGGRAGGDGGDGRGARARRPRTWRGSAPRSREGEVVSPANYNSPEQTVIAGHATAVERASVSSEGRRQAGRAALGVRAPFHCALMEPVKPRLAEVLARCTVSAPRIPVVTNVEAAPNADAARVVPLLLAQVSAPVRWVESVRALAAAGVTRVVELGPGKVLGGL